VWVSCFNNYRFCLSGSQQHLTAIYNEVCTPQQKHAKSVLNIQYKTNKTKQKQKQKTENKNHKKNKQIQDAEIN